MRLIGKDTSKGRENFGQPAKDAAKPSGQSHRAEPKEQDKALESVQQELEQARAQITKLDDELKTAKAELKQAMSTLKDKTDEAAGFKANLENMIGLGGAEHVASLEKELGQSKKSVLELETLREQLQGEIQGLQGRISQLETELAQAQGSAARVQELEAQVKQLMQDVSNTNASAKETIRQHEADWQAKVKVLNDKIRELEAAALSGADPAAQQRIQELKDGIHNLESAMANLRNNLDAEKAKTGRLEQELTQARAENSRLQDLNTKLARTTDETELGKQVRQERGHKRIWMGIASLLIPMTVILAAFIYGFSQSPSAPKTEPEAAPQAEKAPETADVPATVYNLQLYFGEKDPSCVRGKIGDLQPGVLGINCAQDKPVYNQEKDCTDVRPCTIALPKQFAAGGKFPVTAENLKAISSQSDPACYHSSASKAKHWPKDSLRIGECSPRYDSARGCWDYSAASCRIIVPPPAKK